MRARGAVLVRFSNARGHDADPVKDTHSRKSTRPRNGLDIVKRLNQGRTNRRNSAKISVDRNTKITLTLTIAGLILSRLQRIYRTRNLTYDWLEESLSKLPADEIRTSLFLFT